MLGNRKFNYLLWREVTMKTMTCRQLGGACEVEFEASTFEEIAELSKNHGMDMFQKGDSDHLEAMDKMKELMSDQESMKNWMDGKKAEFEALPEHK